MMRRILVLSLDYDDCLVRKDKSYDAVSDLEFNQFINEHNHSSFESKTKLTL